MKNIFTYLLLMMPFSLLAQVYPPDLTTVFPLEDEKIIYQNTVVVDSTLTKDELFVNARMWANNAFYPSTTLIKIEDKQAGILLIESYIVNGTGNYIQDHKIWFTMKLEFRDGRYRYTINGLNSKFIGYYKRYNGPLEEWVPESFQDYIERYMGPKKIEKCREEYQTFFKGVDSDFQNILYTLKNAVKIDRSEEQW